MYMNLYRNLDHRKCVPSGSHIHWHMHTRFVFQCHWNIYWRRCISLAECGTLWAKVSIFCTNKLKKQQVCNGGSALYLDWRNSHHTLVKWWFFFYTEVLCFWNLNHINNTISANHYMQILQNHHTKIRTNVQVNLLITWCHPAARRCPSPSELNTV